MLCRTECSHFWYSPRKRGEYHRPRIQERKGKLVFLFFLESLGCQRISTEILWHQNDAKFSQNPDAKVLGGVGTFFQEGSDLPRYPSITNITKINQNLYEQTPKGDAFHKTSPFFYQSNCSNAARSSWLVDQQVAKRTTVWFSSAFSQKSKPTFSRKAAS